ncbi:leucine zipper domain-containing protein [Streptomyces sp. NPDC001787]|uniref:leucine zipper domain-containing protein n=1 Tax=Streptomyces sp. NPDC001787 TaxID=3154523 RepID=UPI0033296286
MKPAGQHPGCPPRLTFHGRCLLVRRVVLDRRPVAHVAKERRPAHPGRACAPGRRSDR